MPRSKVNLRSPISNHIRLQLEYWCIVKDIFIPRDAKRCLERGFSPVSGVWREGSNSVSKSGAGRAGRRNRRSITGPGGVAGEAFFFCHILVPADCLSVTGGWSQHGQSQWPHTHTHRLCSSRGLVLSSVLSITTVVSRGGRESYWIRARSFHFT